AATFVVGNLDTFTVATSGVPAPALLVTGGVLPSGVTFVDNGNGTATLSGTPATGSNGTYPLTISATNIVGSTSQSFTLTVANPSTPIITSANTATFHVGALESFTVTTAASPVASTIPLPVGIPAGLTWTDNHDGTATLSGRPTLAGLGLHTFTITASNG